MNDTVWKEKYSYSARFQAFKKRLKDLPHKITHLEKSDIKQFLKHSKKPLQLAVLSSIIILILIPIATYLYFIRDLSSKDRIINKKNEGVILLDRNDQPFFTLFEARTKTTVPISDVPKLTQQAFISVEDKDFYNHPGFSINGILRAIRTNIQQEGFAQGGSTISQQLIKNTLLSQTKSLFRKYQELVLAIELERKYSKDDILELYLNTTYFGEGAFGIEDAAKTYFSKKTSELTLGESALLAGIIRAPSALSPISGDREAAIERARLILGLMREQGYIDENQYNEALNENIELNPSETREDVLAVHFALMVQDQLIEKYGEQKVAQSGFVVKTTLDRNLQQAAETAVETQVRRLAGNRVTNGAAVAIEPTTGEVIALVGSHDWNDEENGKINMAVSPRQPGSSFKPIIYGKAIEDKTISAATVLEDKPVSFGSYKPKNYDSKFRNQVLARFALANSLNIPAVHVMNRVGVRNGVKFAEKLGVTTLDENKDYGLPLVLGAAEVPLIEMTNAYASFANEGELAKYILYTEVRDKNGGIEDKITSEKEKVMDNSTAYIISSILSDNNARQEVFGNSLTLSREAAVKTGTTEDYRDALTIGYTPQIAVGAWVGNNDRTPMDRIAGSLGAAPIWRQIMESYLKGKPIVKFSKPGSVLSMSVCKENGLKAEVATSSAYTEFFKRGTLPTRSCTKVEPTPDNDVPQIEEDTPTPEPTETPSPTPQATPTTTATSSGIINLSP